MVIEKDGDALVLWHRTAAGAQILAGGFRDNTGFIIAGLAEEFSGVFVSNVPLDSNEGASGDDLLRVVLRATEEEIDQYEIKDEMGTYREWLMPADFINSNATLTLWDEFEGKPIDNA